MQNSYHKTIFSILQVSDQYLRDIYYILSGSSNCGMLCFLSLIKKEKKTFWLV